jgi:hypothetical protein
MLGMGKSAKERLTFQPSTLPRRQEEFINPFSMNEEKSAGYSDV